MRSVPVMDGTKRLTEDQRTEKNNAMMEMFITRRMFEGLLEKKHNVDVPLKTGNVTCNDDTAMSDAEEQTLHCPEFTLDTWSTTTFAPPSSSVTSRKTAY
ncbi:Coiled-coil and C2 domain-containing protein 1A [Branchiostoma belcheri]|nr:Coiled-coil and C2 domain-containing protein 1A [Branchiostoma belcheri]